MKKTIAFLLVAATVAWADPPAAIPLPSPDTKGGMPLMQALSARRSGREFSDRKLSIETLANLLWAADGINRPDGKRTAPSAMNWQTVDIYAVFAEGAYLYNAKERRLELVVSGDLRAATGLQAFVAQAPLDLVYVSDYARMRSAADSEKMFLAGAETGFIGQNVYLFCASEGLSTVVRGGVNRDALAKALKLRPDQKVTLSQTVGYPKRGGQEK
jgi:SagB-type dehydrogenase family enzyme